MYFFRTLFLATSLYISIIYCTVYTYSPLDHSILYNIQSVVAFFPRRPSGPWALHSSPPEILQPRTDWYRQVLQDIIWEYIHGKYSKMPLAREGGLGWRLTINLPPPDSQFLEVLDNYTIIQTYMFYTIIKLIC